jgi:hypothetical protein
MISLFEAERIFIVDIFTHSERLQNKQMKNE